MEEAGASRFTGRDLERHEQQAAIQRVQEE